jgi:signal transduction histidine kinase
MSTDFPSLVTVRGFLEAHPLFAAMPREHIDALLLSGETRTLAPGEVLVEESQLAESAFVISDGDLEILRTVDGQDVPLAIRSAGDLVGEMGVLTGLRRNATIRARTQATVLTIDGESFMAALYATPESMAVVLKLMIARLQATEMELVQHQKMAALGVLAAGLAHELNNPGSAVKRSAAQLRDAVTAWEAAAMRLGKAPLTNNDIAMLEAQRERMVAKSSETAWLDPLDRADREEEIQDWLEAKGLREPWKLAGGLTDAGWDVVELRKVEERFSAGLLPLVVQWTASGQAVMQLLHALAVGSDAISDIVAAVKAYTRLDQAPVQHVDIHEGIDQSLTIMRYKLRSIQVQRDYAADLPHISAYASQLNQVWTNLFDNAADAMKGAGILTIRTCLDGQWIVVEVIDTGPGMPDEVRDHAFDPFYTTKPPGEGTGMGLSIVHSIIRKHQGDIRIESHPGRTCFSIRLPLAGVPA